MSSQQDSLKILVTGGSGFVGRHLSKALKTKGYSLTSLGRTNLKESDPSTWDESLIADFESSFSIPDLSDFDCVIHLAGHAHSQRSGDEENEKHRTVNYIATEKLIKKAVQDRVTEFIFISSIAVYGEPEPYMEGKTPLVWTEKTPTSPKTPYGVAKKQAEEAIKQVCGDSTSYTILRPTLIYGADAPGNFALLKKLVKSRIPLPLGGFHNQRSFLFIENLCSAIISCIESQSATNQTFNVADSDIVSTPQLIDWMAKASGHRSPVLNLPASLLRKMSSLIGQDAKLDKLTSNCVVDISKIQNTLSWNPPFSTKAGISESM
jgi:nucleoside-diphosphate-sugar epimerase